MALPPVTETVLKEQDRIKAGARPPYWKEFVALKPTAWPASRS